MRILDNCWLLRPFDFFDMNFGLWGDTLRELRMDICALEILDHVMDGGVKVEM